MLGLRRYPTTLLSWGLVSVLIMLTHILLPRELAFDFTALLLAIIGAIYVGFALADGRTAIIVQEVGVASFFVVLAALGLWLNPYLWVLGLVLHAGWDWLHHTEIVRTRVPSYYPPACVLVDLLLALFLAIWLTV